MGCGVGKGWMTLWKICVGQVGRFFPSMFASASSYGRRTGTFNPILPTAGNYRTSRWKSCIGAAYHEL